jgi:hypothetical protein
MYDKCPDSSDQLLNYLNNHNGGVLQKLYVHEFGFFFTQNLLGFSGITINVNACMPDCRRPSPTHRRHPVVCLNSDLTPADARLLAETLFAGPVCLLPPVYL